MYMPLSFAEPGRVYAVKRITGKDETRKHLANLGFVEGTQVMVVQSIDGNLIVEVQNVRIALDKSLANRILV